MHIRGEGVSFDSELIGVDTEGQVSLRNGETLCLLSVCLMSAVINYSERDLSVFCDLSVSIYQ